MRGVHEHARNRAPSRTVLGNRDAQGVWGALARRVERHPAMPLCRAFKCEPSSATRRRASCGGSDLRRRRRPLLDRPSGSPPRLGTRRARHGRPFPPSQPNSWRSRLSQGSLSTPSRLASPRETCAPVAPATESSARPCQSTGQSGDVLGVAVVLLAPPSDCLVTKEGELFPRWGSTCASARRWTGRVPPCPRPATHGRRPDRCPGWPLASSARRSTS